MRLRIPTGVWVTLGTIAFMIWAFGVQGKGRLAREAKPARSGPPCTTKEGWHFALSEDILDKAGRFVSQGDKTAFGKLITGGQLKPLKPGLQVYLEPGGRFGHTAIRLPGTVEAVWVVNEALTCSR